MNLGTSNRCRKGLLVEVGSVKLDVVRKHPSVRLFGLAGKYLLDASGLILRLEMK